MWISLHMLHAAIVRFSKVNGADTVKTDKFWRNFVVRNLFSSSKARKTPKKKTIVHPLTCSPTYKDLFLRCQHVSACVTKHCMFFFKHASHTLFPPQYTPSHTQTRSFHTQPKRSSSSFLFMYFCINRCFLHHNHDINN